ncbi:MAG: GntR family transcriptional regulator, partial [Kiloniellales bacterium]
DDTAPLALRRERLATPSQRRFQAIYHIIRERITLLKYPPGTILDIDALAAEFDVSRTPIRSVLQQLSYHGLVVSRHGVRTSVAPIDFEKLREDKTFRSYLAELIGVLSPLAPSEAAIKAMAEAKAECHELIEHPDLETFARIDMKVHGATCSLIGNRQLLQVYDDLYFRTARVWFYFLPRLDWRQEVTIFHQDIASRLSAMERGDTKAVGFLTRNAVSAVLIRLDALISQLEKAHDPGEPRLPS